jgi:hypothetical protein
MLVTLTAVRPISIASTPTPRNGIQRVQIVATFEEAAKLLQKARGRATLRRCRSDVERGGVYGPFPDGSVLTVEHVHEADVR